MRLFKKTPHVYPRYPVGCKVVVKFADGKTPYPVYQQGVVVHILGSKDNKVKVVFDTGGNPWVQWIHKRRITRIS